jgi:hypothetical protein
MTSAADFYFDAAALSAGRIAAAGEVRGVGVGVQLTTTATGEERNGPLVVAYQGEPGAYSEQACKQLFADCGVVVQPLPCASFSAVFDAVRSGTAQHALVPIENSLGGSIHDNYDLLLRHKVTCVAELQFKVSHCLLALPGVQLQDIKQCYSHAQALAQCEEYLSKLSIQPVKQYDTAGSAKIIAEQGLRNVAAIASELAASTYGLNILARRIEDDEGELLCNAEQLLEGPHCRVHDADFELSFLDRCRELHSLPSARSRHHAQPASALLSGRSAQCSRCGRRSRRSERSTLSWQ